jgi:hypothetical protein
MVGNALMMFLLFEIVAGALLARAVRHAVERSERSDHAD